MKFARIWMSKACAMLERLTLAEERVCVIRHPGDLFTNGKHQFIVWLILFVYKGDTSV